MSFVQCFHHSLLLYSVPSRQGILNKLALEYSTFSTRKTTISSWTYSCTCNIVQLQFKNTFIKAFLRRRGFFNLTDDSGFLSWILLICIGTYKKSSNTILLFFTSKHPVRYSYLLIITIYTSSTIKNNKEINCLKSRPALFSENELLTQQQTTKCPGTTVIFH